jgi:hypothetical protein
LFSDAGLDFLLDPEDTVHFYEAQANNDGQPDLLLNVDVLATFFYKRGNATRN